MAFILAAFCAQGCAHLKTEEELIITADTLPPPRRIERPMEQQLRDFGRMVLAYTGQSAPLIVEVDFIANDSGNSKELPGDLGYYAETAFSLMGGPFRTTRTYPTITMVGPLAATGYHAGNPPVLPAPSIKLKGQLLRASERVIKAREARGDGQGSISGGLVNGGITADDRTTLTGLRVGFMLTTPDGISLPGPTATYEVLARKEEQNFSFGVYFDGSGAGIGSRVQFANDAGDAISDATAACMMRLVGHWLMLPYDRIDPTMTPDPVLRKRLMEKLSAMPRGELESRVKVMLFGSGAAMDMTQASFSDADRTLVGERMATMQLDVAATNDLVKFFLSLWESMDYRTAADRIEQQIAENTRTIADKQAEMARASQEQTRVESELPAQAAGPDTQATTRPSFEFSASEPFIIVNLAAVTDQTTRERLLNEVRSVQGFDDIRQEQSRPGIYGIRCAGRPEDLHRRLRQADLAHNLDLTWSDRWQTLTISPNRTH